ncbi:MAG TPA: DinB family protein [Candidatus Lustribacter sp.]|nr:DinB family protein [Candidatus Lustribacter sp.]
MSPTDRPDVWDERTTLLTMWRYTRAVAAAKCSDAPATAIGAPTVPTSPLTTLGGIANHQRWVEHWWLDVVFLGHEDRAPWTDADPDAEFRIGAEQPISLTLREWADQSAAIEAAIEGHDLDERGRDWRRSTEPPTLRWVLLHLIEENARHNGHLDLLREIADGATG